MDGDKSVIKVTFVAPCGCCHFEIKFGQDGAADVTAKGFTETHLREQMKGLSEYLPSMLKVIVEASPSSVVKSTVQ